MTTVTFPSSVDIESTYIYDDADRLTGIEHVKGGTTTVAFVEYDLDDVGTASSAGTTKARTSTATTTSTG